MRMLSEKSRYACLLFISLMALMPFSMAHLMPAQNGTINLKGNAAFVVISLPVSALSAVDDNHDGRLSDAELQQHMEAIQAQVQSRFALSNAKVRGRVDFIQINIEPDENHVSNQTGGKHFLVLMKLSFEQPLLALHLETSLFGSSNKEQQLSIKAIRENETEVAILSPRQAQHHFFQAPFQVMLDFVKLGVEHILTGADHLLFLLTILVAAAGWRYWLGVLTSFTIAHSITLSLGLMNIIHAPATIIEPLITLSIMLMALLNLFKKAPRPGARIAIIFSCGLLHGLGFASAMEIMGLHGTYQLMSIVGFNLGIELGQLLFFLTFLSLLFALKNILGERGRRLLFSSSGVINEVIVTRFFSGLALLISTVWLIQR
jgi:hydrogenase/urease accessory protein HupE